MKEFVASIREISVNFPVSAEEKAQERERIERDGVGVLRVSRITGIGWSPTKESSVTFAAAREMGYTYFDCVEVERPVPVVVDKKPLERLKKALEAQQAYNVAVQWTPRPRGTTLRPTRRTS